MIKQVRFKTIGMQKDNSESAYESQFAFHNYNVRITPDGDNTLFSIVNERGQQNVDIYNDDDELTSLLGIPIGQAIVDNTWIIFSTEHLSVVVPGEVVRTDYIYKIQENNGKLYCKCLYNGDLNFSVYNPIETLVSVENLDVQKVYWVDGINQPRVINIASSDDIIQSWNNNSFDLVGIPKWRKEITVNRNNSGGNFASGVIQYAFSLYTMYGKESNIFYTSPLHYISYSDRGASPEEKVTCSFTIDISDSALEYSYKEESTFDYIRIYSIHRTSINSVPEVKRVADLKLSDTIHYTDTGINGDLIDPTELLYLGGEEIIAGTINQKDNTLFLGDITLNKKIIPESVREYFKNEKTVYFTQQSRTLESAEEGGYYPYVNQLNYNSSKIKTFKYLETYRFGIQAQHKSGKWSEPIWVGDYKNNIPINTSLWDSGEIKLPTAECVIPESVLYNLFTADYVRIRPVVVFPSLAERDIICQGVLCPTVYNVGDRADNSPFVQSSWFIRPNAPFDLSSLSTTSLGQSNENSEYSTGGITQPTVTIPSGMGYKVINTFDKGVPIEFRHDYPIPGNDDYGAEIQCIVDPEGSPYLSNSEDQNNPKNWISKNSHNFYIDQSIVTLHSPDLEFTEEIQNLNLSNVKLRIIGAVPLTSFVSDVDIQTSTPPMFIKNTNTPALGFYKKTFGVKNEFSLVRDGQYIYKDSHFGYRMFSSYPLWVDEIFERITPNDSKTPTGFVVYPWHRNGSLNNAAASEDIARPSMLLHKKMSNLKFSYKTLYFNGIWEPGNGISGVSIFNSNEVKVSKIPAPLNSGLEKDISYYGNIDKVLINKEPYPIITSITDMNGNPSGGSRNILSTDYTTYTTSTDPVRIKYKSTAHAVLALNYTNDGKINILPTQGSQNRIIDENSKTTFWNTNVKGIVQDVLDFEGLNGPIYTEDDREKGLQHGYLWLGELYRDPIENKFGGQTEEAFENNQWLPCGEPINIYTRRIQDGRWIPKSDLTIHWTEGDTYFQRYDHLKTYPFTLEDQNSVTEIISFMCETRVNIDGRYDKNRGKENNLVTTPDNFNKLNKVYSQENNFFNYRGLNYNRFSLDKFPHTITWTKTKSPGELVDSWTNITLASTLDLDGTLGPVRSLKRLNNQLVAFQDKGISQVLYNESTQISTTEGVPIEIANSGKVSGRRYITNTVGCKNKWSICETPYGLYFVDGLNKSIYLFNGEILDITTKLGFDSWAKKSIDNSIWNPSTFNGFASYYDPIHKDVLFIDNNQCLAYSEIVGKFTSFYSYERIPYIAKVGDRLLSLNYSLENKDSKSKSYISANNEGDYNYFWLRDTSGNYNKVFRPFSTTVIVNPDPYKDKIFNNVEFRADSWDSDGKLLNTTLDKLEVWNEYQHGEVDLIFNRNVPSSLKKKFRTWRVNIPRDDSNGRDRIRNPWTYIKLSSELENTYKTILHDMVVTYYE